MRVDAGMLSLPKALSPQAYESLHGNEGRTTVGGFLGDHLAPIDVEL